jgi:polar amino acid transport system substrate-binding protein
VERVAARIDTPVGAIAAEEPPAATQKPDAKPVATAEADELRLLADGGFSPFADEAEDAGGLVTDLLRRAITAGDAERAVSVSFVADRSAHLAALLPSGAFDVSFPWVKPDCGQPETLGADALRRCETLSFSRPLVEVTVAFYGRIGDPLVMAANAEALAGKRICRPEAAMIPDLALGPVSALSQTAATAEDCFARLRNGEADVVSLLKDRADAAIGRLGYGEGVIEIPALRSTRSLHAVAMKGSLAGEAALAEIDRGIERIMLSGGWFETVAAHRSQDAALR